jgi:hypothetical protein
VAEQTLPRDPFSVRRRELIDNPGAIRSSSTIDVADVYGNVETWRVETFRTDGNVEALVQVNKADGGFRLVIPPKVMEAFDRQRGSIIGAARRRGARQALETKREKGQRIGNPEALRKGRRSRKK